MSYDSALARYAADGTYAFGTSIGGFGFQQTSAIALSLHGELYWLVAYWGALKYGEKVLVEPLPDDPWGVESPWGTAILALPP